MPIDMILPISITISMLTWALIFYWYVHPVLRVRTMAEAMTPLLLLHCFRYVGLMFLIPGVTTQALDSRFANPAAYGDLLAAILAFMAIIALRMNLRWKTAFVWVFNTWGFVDLVNAVSMGLMYTADGHLGATYWIPATIVPLLLVSHIYIFMLLTRLPLRDQRSPAANV